MIDATRSASPTTLSAELAKLRTRLNTASTVYESIDELKDQLKENNTESASAQRTANTLERDLAAAQERSKKMTAHIAGARKKLKGQRAAEKAMEDLNILRDKADVDSKTDELNRATRNLKRVQKLSMQPNGPYVKHMISAQKSWQAFSPPRLPTVKLALFVVQQSIRAKLGLPPPQNAMLRLSRVNVSLLRKN